VSAVYSNPPKCYRSGGEQKVTVQQVFFFHVAENILSQGTEPAGQNPPSTLIDDMGRFLIV